jgi:hypothetical protein
MAVGPFAFLSCRETARSLAQGELDGDGEWFARLHLLYCGWCRLFLKQLRLIARAAKAGSARLLNDEERKALEARVLGKLTTG